MKNTLWKAFCNFPPDVSKFRTRNHTWEISIQFALFGLNLEMKTYVPHATEAEDARLWHDRCSQVNCWLSEAERCATSYWKCRKLIKSGVPCQYIQLILGSMLDNFMTTWHKLKPSERRESQFRNYLHKMGL